MTLTSDSPDPLSNLQLNTTIESKNMWNISELFCLFDFDLMTLVLKLDVTVVNVYQHRKQSYWLKHPDQTQTDMTECIIYTR